MEKMMAKTKKVTQIEDVDGILDEQNEEGQITEEFVETPEEPVEEPIEVKTPPTTKVKNLPKVDEGLLDALKDNLIFSSASQKEPVVETSTPVVSSTPILNYTDNLDVDVLRLDGNSLPIKRNQEKSSIVFGMGR
jgi:hypothetical protein